MVLALAVAFVGTAALVSSRALRLAVSSGRLGPQTPPPLLTAVLAAMVTLSTTSFILSLINLLFAALEGR